MTENVAITVAYGDGIGPEIMEATLFILKEAKARIHVETVEIGKRLYEQGHTSGIAPYSLDHIRRTKAFLKAPITTPQGGGYKSLNVTLRRMFGLYANIRPCISYAPYIPTLHPNLDVVIIRENEEDLYTGIENRPTATAYESLKLITQQGCEKITSFAFNFALAQGRKKITCMTKDNIMKFTDGLFHKVFDTMAPHFPEITAEHYIVDIGAARLANRPETFDMVLTENMYGDILSDITAEASGSVGLAGSANIGDHYAMFEAIHGSAPKHAGEDTANPSGLLNAAIMMLVHLGQAKTAATIRNAWLKTLEDGIHTYDIYNEKTSQQRVGTRAFAKAVAARLGQTPATLPVAQFNDTIAPVQKREIALPAAFSEGTKTWVGVDIAFEWQGDDTQQLASTLLKATKKTALQLQFISNRGLKIWPGEAKMPTVGDYWRARFFPAGPDKTTTHKALAALLAALDSHAIAYTKIENLYLYGDMPGFSLAQGE